MTLAKDRRASAQPCRRSLEQPEMFTFEADDDMFRNWTFPATIVQGCIGVTYETERDCSILLSIDQLSCNITAQRRASFSSICCAHSVTEPPSIAH